MLVSDFPKFERDDKYFLLSTNDAEKTNSGINGRISERDDAFTN
jgi:hypothetical protein